MVTHVIFDLDGTLLNTLGDLAASVNFALSENGLPVRSIDEIRRFIGNGIRKLIARSVPECCPPELEGEVFSCFKAHYSENCLTATRPYEGIPELLQELSDSGISLAVVSNKADALSKKLMAHFYPDRFAEVWGEREGVAKKPSPEPLLSCCRSIGAAVENVLYVGDTEVDLETARAAGCRCALVTWGFRSHDEVCALAPDHVINTPDEIVRILL